MQRRKTNSLDDARRMASARRPGAAGETLATVVELTDERRGGGDPATREPNPAARLVRAAQAGDRAALEQVIAQHRASVFGYLRSRLLEPADAEDLCQEVFLRLYLGRARFEGAAPLGPWLVGVARNVLREHVRWVKRRKEVAWTELCLGLEELVESEASQRFDEALAHLPQCLESLGPSARQALEMRYQARLRLSDIGQKLHRSEGAIKLLMFRARQALKHCLDFKLEAARGDESREHGS